MSTTASPFLQNTPGLRYCMNGVAMNFKAA
jgi:peptide methionine sulfoxide reductase MsrB